MKIVRFKKSDDIYYGVVVGETINLIDGDIFSGYVVTDHVIALKDVRLLAPVEPPNIIGIGLNYKSHAKELKMDFPKAPVIFVKTTNTLAGPEDKIVLPRMAPGEVDYEAELAVVIGKRAKEISDEHAIDYVLGYTCSQDISARDCQVRYDVQWARGKSFDTFCPIGPCIQTEMDPDNARITLRLNGKTMQDSNTSDLIFSCSKLVSYVSHCMTLFPGTLILTGTPSGVGFKRKPPVFLRAGDNVEVEIENIGVLRNSVA
ncbi:MAG: fumarylacetoacetate hydrolase family protein [Spirochaetota bacterium]|nr:MAG: fumarylacetoacetate hydrolase family protein [Spirochaetota bacterium]